MARRDTDDHSDQSHMVGRLRQLERLLAPPTMPAPRAAAEAAPLPALRDVEPHRSRMYVAGREPHFRDITLLQPAHAARHGTQPE